MSHIALVLDTTVPLTHNLLKIQAEKIMKYENLTLEIINIWKLNNVPISSQSSQEWSPTLSKISR